jgi:predicted lipid-binding transport protein (Tim44 family)
MRRLMPFLLALMLALAPGFAQARPGLGGSMGSRGSATWSTPSGAAPLQRSVTPNYGTPGYGGYSNYGGYGGYRSSFGHGLLGGFLGAGLLGMMLGRGFFGFHSGFGFLGLLIQLTVLFFVGRWLLTRFFGVPAFAGAGGMFARGGFMQPGPAAGRPSGGIGGSIGGGGARRPLTVTQADYQQFTQLLMAVQGAWSRQDLTGLQAMATPEMVGYFNEQLSDLASRGARNEVRDVRLLQGDLSEAWSEAGRDYATVSLKFSIIDVTFDRAGHVVDGSPTERVTVTEFWTFVRRLPGHWILSAIQQAR